MKVFNLFISGSIHDHFYTFSGKQLPRTPNYNFTLQIRKERKGIVGNTFF